MEKIKVGIVNYLNTRPLVYGIEHSNILQQIELVGDYPSNVAKALLSGSIDVGLVPVAIIPRLNEFHVITDSCIGCDGEVASVCLFSDVPLEQVERVLLDYQSRTSVELARILLKDYWKSDAELVSASSDYRQQIKGTTAGLVIGDRSFEQRLTSPYIYDLGLAWKQFTGLPFVFAAWISNKKLDDGFVRQFDEANKNGRNSIDEVLKEMSYDKFDLDVYYRNFIQYNLDELKRKGLELFLSRIRSESVRSEIKPA